MLALVIRLPSLLAQRALGYDDGVYGASAIAMRHGEAPFRTVYSSQGPLFLPLVWLADLVGLRWTGAPRLLAVGAGLAVVVLTAALCRLVAGPVGTFVGTVLVACSGVLLLGTGRLESDGVVAAIGAGAVLAATGSGSVPVGLLVGLALSAKSLMALPPALAALWLLQRRLGLKSLLPAVAVAVAVVAATSLPWGLRDVWRQSVALHIAADSGFDPLLNLKLLASDLRRYDPVLLLAVGAALAGWVAFRRSFTSDVARAAAIWFLGGFVVLVAHTPLFTHHMGLIVAPAAVLVASQAPERWTTLVALAVLIPLQAGALRFQLHEPDPAFGEVAAMADLRDLVPPGAAVITDWPGLAWWAGHPVPGNLVDPSLVRIGAGALTTATVAAGAQAPGVCAVLFWSTRFESLRGLGSMLTGYVEVRQYGFDRRLYIRSSCEAQPAAKARSIASATSSGRSSGPK